MAADRIVYTLQHLTDYRQFERLCTDILSQSGYPDIELLGGSNDGGRDAIHISRQNPGEVTLFAYSVRSDWKQKLLQDCKRIKEEDHIFKKLIFACTSEIPATSKDKVREAVESEYGWPVEFYDIERLRTRLSNELRYLVAQHGSIFTPPFFPVRGGISIEECRDTLVIDHVEEDHAFATWLARRLQISGYRVWSFGTAPLVGQNADESVRTLIEKRAQRYLPVLSVSSVSNADFLSRCSLAVGIDELVLPCQVSSIDKRKMPSKVKQLSAGDFSKGWASGLENVLNTLQSQAVQPIHSTEQGRAIALRSFVPLPVIKESPERVFSNTFPVTVPQAILVCELERPISDDEKMELRRDWAFVEADSHKLLSFETPPNSVPLVESVRLASYDWSHFEFKFNKRSTNIVKELIHRSLDLSCLMAGMQWCTDRREYYFPQIEGKARKLNFTHVDGRETHVSASGQISYGTGDRAKPFLYQLCPAFRASFDESMKWWVTLRIYIRVTDLSGVPIQGKGIIRRRKKVTKSWWNNKWLARILGMMQALADPGTDEINVGSGDGRLTVSTKPLSWECPMSIDYRAVDSLGDFQEEMALYGYQDNESEDEGESENE